MIDQIKKKEAREEELQEESIVPKAWNSAKKLVE